MKLVIDIPKEEYERLKEQSIFGSMVSVWKQAIKNGTPLPEGYGRLIDAPKEATNGDMIQAMFPYGEYGTNGNEVHVFGVGGNGCLVFTLDWWNAPYKAERTEE